MTETERKGLAELVSEPPKFDEPMRHHTTIRVGGRADALVVVRTLKELQQVIRFAREIDSPLFILGEGSNLIVRDGGIRGIVVQLSGELVQVSFDTTEVKAGGGAYLPHLVIKTAQQSLSGLECCAGVPGTVGGALVGNAGTADEFIGDTVKRVTVVTEDGEIRVLDRSDLRFSYRWSNLRQHGLVIVNAVLDLQLDNPEAIRERIRHHLRYRWATQPIHVPCAGCIFKNPQGERAGRLIDLAGMKGERIGDAQVSTVHANFIVNLGNATAKDVFALAELMCKAVLEKFNILLEYEVQIVGEDDG